MGKSRGRGHKQPRNNPIGMAANQPDSDGEMVLTLPFNQAGKQQVLSATTLKSLAQQLQSASVEDRDCACNALAALVRNSDDSLAALHEGLIKILGPLLLDTSPSVCHSASSALHSIISSGGDDVIKLATEHDILTPLVTLLKKIPSQWKPVADPGAKIDTATATFVEVVGILSFLSESSTLAVDRMHKEGIVTPMISYLDEKIYGSEVVASVAQFLCTSTEDQGDVDYSSSLKAQLISKILGDEGSNACIKTLAVTILLNLNKQSVNMDLGLSAEEVVAILNSSLSQDHRKSASLVVDFLPIHPDDEEEDSMEGEGGSRETKLVDAFTVTDRLLSTQIKALEILTNLCCSADSDSLDDDQFYDSCSETSIEGGGLEESAIELNPELKAAFLQAGLFQSVVERARMPAENIIESLSQYQTGKLLLKRYETLQCRAFLCLSNMVSTLELENMGGGKELFNIWCGLAVSAFENGSKSEQVLEAATASMRAIIHKLARHQDDIVGLLKTEEIVTLCQKVSECSHPQSRVNLLQVLGILGSMAAGREPPLIEPRAAIVRTIGLLLVDTACREPNLWVVAEAMDAIFDVFKEDHTDAVGNDVQLVERLRTMAPGFKSRVHAQRRNLPADHLPIVMTVKDNLLRFIKYKTKIRSSARI